MGILVTVICLVGALWGIDFKEVHASFRRANYATLPVLLVFLFIYFWLKAIRWTLLLRPLRGFQTHEVVGAMMIGFMGNNLLPAHLGEFARVFVLGREFKLRKTAVLSSVVLERVFDAASILGFFGVSLLLVELPETYKTTSLYLAGLTVAAFLVLAVYVFWTERFVRAVQLALNRLRFLPTTLCGALTEILESGVGGLASLRSAKLASWIVITSALQWILMGGMVHVALWSFGVHLPLRASFVVVGVTALGVAVPSTPGFFGVIQFCFWVSLRIFGVEKVDAFAASVYYHLSQYIPVTLVGLYYLGRLGLRVGDITREAVHEVEPEPTKATGGPGKAPIPVPASEKSLPAGNSE
ncbi:MAG: lysylphosphatidylglycerol synthase transmembrane domain-containing protein [Candidatus Binatia bacterium]